MLRRSVLILLFITIITPGSVEGRCFSGEHTLGLFDLDMNYIETLKTGIKIDCENMNELYAGDDNRLFLVYTTEANMLLDLGDVMTPPVLSSDVYPYMQTNFDGLIRVYFRDSLLISGDGVLRWYNLTTGEYSLALDLKEIQPQMDYASYTRDGDILLITIHIQSEDKTDQYFYIYDMIGNQSVSINENITIPGGVSHFTVDSINNYFAYYYNGKLTQMDLSTSDVNEISVGLNQVDSLRIHDGNLYLGYYPNNVTDLGARYRRMRMYSSNLTMMVEKLFRYYDHDISFIDDYIVVNTIDNYNYDDSNYFGLDINPIFLLIIPVYACLRKKRNI